jgi:polyribonucleotide nucleotidyltransferase
MASVCGASLALMDAGVRWRSGRRHRDGPMKSRAFAVLSDILMTRTIRRMDFKVAGTERGITALQMDIKITSITEEIMGCPRPPRDGRAHILGETKALTGARGARKRPRTTISIPRTRSARSSGRAARSSAIVETTGAKIDRRRRHDQDSRGRCRCPKAAIDGPRSIVASPNSASFTRKVVKTVDFGAVNFLGSRDGLVHISEPRRGGSARSPMSSRSAIRSRSRFSASTTAARSSQHAAGRPADWRAGDRRQREQPKQGAGSALTPHLRPGRGAVTSCPPLAPVIGHRSAAARVPETPRRPARQGPRLQLGRVRCAADRRRRARPLS